MTLKGRLVGTAIVILGVSVAVFLLMHLAPGDPVRLLLPENASGELVEQTRREWGLDRAMPIQYGDFMRKAIQGDLGKSFKFDEPVTNLIIERLPATLELAFMSFLISILISIPVGVLSAARQNSFWDHASMITALMGASLPHFWLGIMLIFLFGGVLGVLPVSGRIDYGVKIQAITRLYLLDSLLSANWTGFGHALKHILMPACTLGIALSAIVTRITRSSMLDVIRQDYMITARAKGLSESMVLWKHGFRNALCTIITILGLQLGTLLAGSIVIETVFSWPGIGSLLIQAISFRDYKLVQGVTLFFAIIYISINFAVDILYTIIDPRVRI
jgi:ABC-type dipeptide/oligopeptide/nickel transport system permease component